MRKLQLIKPWRLSAIRQRLVEAREDRQEPIFTPANAPEATYGAVVVRGDTDGRSANRKQAPVSDVVYIPRSGRACR